jgi:hypothetical protein
MKRFINLIYSQAKFSAQCNIIALIFVNRMTLLCGVNLSMKNWRGVWLGAVILAQKIWDDHPLKTSAFCSILPCVSKKRMKNLELSAYCLPNFSTGVKPSQYAKCYFGLRALYSEMTGHNEANDQFNLKPLSLLESLRLEDRSFRNGVLKHGVHHSHGRLHHKHNRNNSTCSQLNSALTTPIDLSNINKINLIHHASTSSSINVLNNKSCNNIYSSNIHASSFLTSEFFATKTLEDATVVNTTRFVIS